MSSKQRLALLLVVFVGGALWAGIPFARAMRYRFMCEEVLERVAARPAPANVFALADELRQLAPKAGIDPGLVQITISLRRVGFEEAPTYYLRAQIQHGKFDDLLVAKVDDEHATRDYILELAAGGVELSGMPEEAAFAAAADATE